MSRPPIFVPPRRVPKGPGLLISGVSAVERRGARGRGIPERPQRVRICRESPSWPDVEPRAWSDQMGCPRAGKHRPAPGRLLSAALGRCRSWSTASPRG